MPVINRFADLHPSITEWRRDIHEHPEILFDTHRTSALVALYVALSLLLLLIGERLPQALLRGAGAIR